MNSTVLKIIYYLWNNKLIVLLGIYFLVSILINIGFSINVCIPCIWNIIFGVKCPGCGLTSAFIKLLQLDVLGAFKTNWLLFVVIPFAVFYIKMDYNKFSKNLGYV